MWKIKQGFTLVELLVVMGVIGVLASVVTAMVIGNNIGKGNDARRKSDLEAIRSAVELFKNDNGYYPPTNTGTPTVPPSAWVGWCDNVNDTWTSGTALSDQLKAGGYLTNMPVDPTRAGTAEDYFYVLNSSNSYYLEAKMDVVADGDGQTYNHSSCAHLPFGPDGTVTFDYRLTNL